MTRERATALGKEWGPYLAVIATALTAYVGNTGQVREAKDQAQEATREAVVAVETNIVAQSRNWQSKMQGQIDLAERDRADMKATIAALNTEVDILRIMAKIPRVTLCTNRHQRATYDD